MLALALVLVVNLLPLATATGADDLIAGEFLTGSLEHDGYNRTYEYYIPSGYDGSEAVPLLFSFHGHTSTGVEQIYLTNFTELAEQEGFIAVFPDSTELEGERWWNVGVTGFPQFLEEVDDVGFVAELIDWFDSGYNTDQTRIYATGMSNGAMFTYYVALNLPGTFAGIAAVTSPMTLNMFEFEDVKPMTVIEMHGTDDPIVPYDGGGWVGSVEDTINFWIEVNETSAEPEVTVWEPTEEDSTRVVRYVYSGGRNGTEVVLYKIEGGGHTWPGGPQYAPPQYIGLVSYHIDGSEKIWEHFSLAWYDLTIDSSDGGSVTTPGEGTFYYDEGKEVYLVAEPKEYYRFFSWTGDVATIHNVHSPLTTITMYGNYSITATFRRPCFIATAAYGTPMAEEIQILREFRDEYLITNPLGQAFVDLYYRVSPPIAEFITEHPSLKPIVRTVLVPAVVMSTIATNTALAEKIVLVGSLVLVSVVVAIWVTRRRRKGSEYT
jgi:polyhydroxybutyrate depolymerase